MTSKFDGLECICDTCAGDGSICYMVGAFYAEPGADFSKVCNRYRRRAVTNYEKLFGTPEQAIAATLGSEREKRLEKLVRIYGEIGNYFCERFACCDAEFASCKYCIGLPQGGQCELGWCNDESKALGIEQPDYGGGECEPVNLEELYDRIGELENELAERGVLTAEQVQAVIFAHSSCAGRVDGKYFAEDIRMQAIADELNDELGSGTCENANKDGYGFRFDCTECGYSAIVLNCATRLDELPSFCPNCGKRVTR